jgi:hypothetical protein
MSIDFNDNDEDNMCLLQEDVTEAFYGFDLTNGEALDP